jgi:23S rRNA (cytidine1920-2'-O)/16S rRNA (cytidine1409-2'-O)-methyltransferase
MSLVTKSRLDKLLVDRGFSPTREKARALILSGSVIVREDRVDKAGALFPEDVPIRIKGEDNPYVSRGGLKLRAALGTFDISVTGLVAMDVGASTGGFTDCLLQAGASKVYALDVGYGQFAWKLREDPRVVVIERTNVRYYHGKDIIETIDLATIDTSFISLKLVIPAVFPLIGPEASIIALIKPQFEVGREKIQKHGVVKDPRLHDEVIKDIERFCQGLNLHVQGICESPLLGPAGNKEFFIHLNKKISA